MATWETMFCGGISFVMFVVGAWFLWATMESVRARRELAMRPVQPAGTAAGAKTRVSGRLVAAGPLVRSEDGRTGLYYRARIERLVQRGKNAHWVDAVDIQRAAPCALEDESGQILLDLDPYWETEIVGGEDPVVESTAWTQVDPPDHMLPLIRKAGIPLNGVLYRTGMRFHEQLIRPGDLVEAWGAVDENTHTLEIRHLAVDGLGSLKRKDGLIHFGMAMAGVGLMVVGGGVLGLLVWLGTVVA